MKIPKLDLGKGFLGPEFFGCHNTGMRTAIFHAKNNKWVVGPEMYARIVLREAGHYSNKRLHKFNTRIVYVFKGRGSAIKKFNELCSEIMAWNEQQV
jgi:hypothetical protein